LLKTTERPSHAIIVGLDSMQGLQAARILAARNVPVIAIAKDKSYHSCRTRVCEKILYTDTESKALIETLERLGPELPSKAVIFPCQDTNVLLISRHRKRLSRWYHIALPAPETVEMLMDKVAFYTCGMKRGWPVPKTFILNSKEDLAEACDELTFPCILKPGFRSPEWIAHTSLKAFKVSDPKELTELFDKYIKWTNVLIAQQWLEGTDEDLYSCNGYFDSKGVPLVTFVARKLRQWPPRTGQSCLGEECRNDHVLNETLRLFEEVGYRGLGYVEMKKDARTGAYYIVEPNIGRPTGRSAIAEAGGVELLYTMYCDCTGRPLPKNRQQEYTGVKWIHILRDLQSTLYYWKEGEITFKSWRQSVRGKKAYALFSWTDPIPFVMAVWRAGRMILSSKERI